MTVGKNDAMGAAAGFLPPLIRTGLTRPSSERQLPKTFCTFIWESSFSWQFLFSARFLARQFDWLMSEGSGRWHNELDLKLIR